MSSKQNYQLQNITMLEIHQNIKIGTDEGILGTPKEFWILKAKFCT